MSLHLGEQPSIKDDNTQIRVENQEKEKKDMQTQMNRTKKLNGAIWWLYREWRGEVVRAHGW